MKSKHAANLLIVLCCAAAPMPEPKIADVAEGYKKLHLMTEKPHLVASEFVTLCAPLTPERFKKMRGPHAFTSINVFMNDAAHDAFKSGAAYPVGSVIVKEKSPDKDNKDASIYLGGMVKRLASEKTSVDDWEFFYVKAGEKPVQDVVQMASCRDCHANAGKTGFVFGYWNKVQTKGR